MKGMQDAKLWKQGDIVMLDLLNSTPEPDGTVKRYVIPVDDTLYGGRAGRECIAASASTWRKRGDRTQLVFASPEAYQPAFES
jgi:pyrimidine operon attenuation protein/uracil phosphoribosyltransferase